jgi:hypothetical protein
MWQEELVPTTTFSQVSEILIFFKVFVSKKVADVANSLRSPLAK